MLDGEKSMNYAIILSGGTGARLGLDIPKQYYEVNNKSVIRYVIETMEQCDTVDGIVIVAAPEWQEYVREQISIPEKFLGFAEPGENRQLSIYSGLCYLRDQLFVQAKNEDELRGDFARAVDLNGVFVLIQDAARPNTSLELIEQCFNLEDGVDGAMPVLPMKDTVYLSEDGKQVSSLLDRKKVYAGQAPESFRLGKYLDANEVLLPTEILKINGSTEPAILAGMNICMIPGEEDNYKITTEADLSKFEETHRI